MTLEQEILIREKKASEKSRVETLVELVRDGLLNIDEAAKRADMTAEEFRALLDHQVEMPDE